jgi:hypothetical protein
VQTDLLNAAIGSGLVDQIADLDEGPSKGRPHRMRTLRRIVFGGITGDPAMIGQLEKSSALDAWGSMSTVRGTLSTTFARTSLSITP